MKQSEMTTGDETSLYTGGQGDVKWYYMLGRRETEREWCLKGMKWQGDGQIYVVM